MKFLKIIIQSLTIAILIVAGVGMAIGAKILNHSAAIFKNSDSPATPLITVISELKSANWNTDIHTLTGGTEGRTNILLLGKGGKGHPGGELTDAMMMVSIKYAQGQENGGAPEVALISIPRDLYVPIADTPYYTRINAIKAYGETYFGPKKAGKSDTNQDWQIQKEKAGADFLDKTIANVLGVPAHYYLELDFDGFTNIIDMLGGIDYTLDEDINDPLYPGPNYSYDPFYLKKGFYHLDGQTTLKLMRTRHSREGDFNRIARQQKLLSLIKDKIVTGNPLRDLFLFSKISQNLSDHLSTNMTLADFRSLWEIGKKVDPQKIIYQTIDKDSGLLKGQVVNGADVLVPRSEDYTDIRDTAYYVFDANREKTISERVKNNESENNNASGAAGLAEEKPTVTLVTQHPNNFIYDRIVSTLKDKGFTITGVTENRSGQPLTEQTLIYDNTSGKKPASLDYLQKSFNAKSLEPGQNNPQVADFTIWLNI